VFLGPSYNLLTRNCNHFSSHLCAALTGQSAPAYLNRAASIGVALPCVVPAGWVEPPECELEDQSEEARLTRRDRPKRRRRRSVNQDRHCVNPDDVWEESSEDNGGYTSDESESERRLRERKLAEIRKRAAAVREGGALKDAQGRELPGAERARLDTTVT